MANLIFAKGVLFIDPLSVTSPGNIELAELNDVSVEFRDSTVKARGKGLYPLASELAERDVTLRASWLKVQTQGIKRIIGGTVNYAASKTTLALNKDSAPSTFRLSLKTPSDGTDAEMIFYKVRPLNFTFPMALKEFSMPNAEFEVMVDEDNSDKVFDLILPGYQSVYSAVLARRPHRTRGARFVPIAPLTL